MRHRRRASRRGRGPQTAAGLRLPAARLRREGSKPQQAVRAVPETDRRRRLAHQRRAAARSRRRRRGGRTAEGSGEAHLRALRGGDQRGHQQHSHGAHRQREESEARGAGHRRPGAQQRVIVGRLDHLARLRRVHVHAFRERLHLFGGAGAQARAHEAAAVRSGHSSPVPRCRQVPRAIGGPE